MFITLEGIEGSGKTTQVDAIAGWLQAAGHRVLTTREPGGTAIGGQIRSILLHPDNHDMAATTELLLYVADRAQHLETVIRPALSAGKVVVCDRFFDATLVYQGYARGLDRTLIRKLHHLACDGMQPSLTLLLDLDPEIGLRRAWQRIHSDAVHASESRFEKETLAFHQRVRAGYLDLAVNAPQRFVVVDAGREPAAVTRQIEAALAAYFLQ
ncbi:Thymidylate kinase [Desulfosarcina cetonica]|uniref:dTMP kinase n=1 Tax=Desulfosarcina cetonica TaxID=90730 RepID=UPI0006D217F1|nr:dTMP kinase [Desulfosarcina cetonica]VTR64009.1 Thymidylate kinase [Desulfosarcina cetonica]